VAAPLLSILVLMVPSRLRAPDVIEELTRQASGKPVEVLALYDNKTRSVGLKRQSLLSVAAGKYVVFVDDDDAVAPDYVDAILGALETDPDVVSFDIELTENGGRPKRCTYGIRFATFSGPDGYQGKPTHTHVWRRSIATYEPFPDCNFGEDATWSRKLARHVKREVRIDRVLYYYRFDQQRSETRCSPGAEP